MYFKILKLLLYSSAQLTFAVNGFITKIKKANAGLICLTTKYLLTKTYNFSLQRYQSFCSEKVCHGSKFFADVSPYPECRAVDRSSRRQCGSSRPSVSECQRRIDTATGRTCCYDDTVTGSVPWCYVCTYLNKQ